MSTPSRRRRWRIHKDGNGWWIASDPTCDFPPGPDCGCGTDATWAEALAHVDEQLRNRALAAVQDGAA